MSKSLKLPATFHQILSGFSTMVAAIRTKPGVLSMIRSLWTAIIAHCLQPCWALGPRALPGVNPVGWPSILLGSDPQEERRETLAQQNATYQEGLPKIAMLCSLLFVWKHGWNRQVFSGKRDQWMAQLAYGGHSGLKPRLIKLLQAGYTWSSALDTQVAAGLWRSGASCQLWFLGLILERGI